MLGSMGNNKTHSIFYVLASLFSSWPATGARQEDQIKINF